VHLDSHPAAATPTKAQPTSPDTIPTKALTPDPQPPRSPTRARWSTSSTTPLAAESPLCRRCRKPAGSCSSATWCRTTSACLTCGRWGARWRRGGGGGGDPLSVQRLWGGAGGVVAAIRCRWRLWERMGACCAYVWMCVLCSNAASGLIVDNSYQVEWKKPKMRSRRWEVAAAALLQLSPHTALCAMLQYCMLCFCCSSHKTTRGDTNRLHGPRLLDPGPLPASSRFPEQPPSTCSAAHCSRPLLLPPLAL